MFEEVQAGRDDVDSKEKVTFPVVFETESEDCARAYVTAYIVDMEDEILLCGAETLMSWNTMMDFGGKSLYFKDSGRTVRLERDGHFLLKLEMVGNRSETDADITVEESRDMKKRSKGVPKKANEKVNVSTSYSDKHYGYKLSAEMRKSGEIQFEEGSYREEEEHKENDEDEGIKKVKGELDNEDAGIGVRRNGYREKVKKNGVTWRNEKEDEEEKSDTRRAMTEQEKLKTEIGEGSYREEVIRKTGQGRSRFCHYWNNGVCKEEECEFLHKESPECRAGRKCSMRKCMYRHPNEEDWSDGKKWQSTYGRNGYWDGYRKGYRNGYWNGYRDG